MLLQLLENNPRKVNTEPGKSPERFRPRCEIQLPSFIIFVSVQSPWVISHCSFCRTVENYQQLELFTLNVIMTEVPLLYYKEMINR